MDMACLRSVRTRVAASVAALAIGGASVAVPAQAAETDYAYGKGEFLSGSIAGVDLASIVEIEPAVAENRGEQKPSVATAKLNVRALDAIEVRLEDALQLLPDNGFISLGAANQYAEAAALGSSRAASGAVNDSGAISLGGTNEWPANATFHLGGLLGDEVADALADVRLEIGALSATAEQVRAGDPVGGYQIADLTLEAHSELITGLAETVDRAVGVVEEALTGLAGTGGVLAAALETVSGVTALVGSDGVEISIDAELREAVVELFGQTLGDGVVEIDLSSGVIRIDLAKLVDLNNLPVGTEILSTAVMLDVVARVDALLGSLVADVVETVTAALHRAELLIDVDATVLGSGVRLTMTGPLSDVLNGEAEGGDLKLVLLGAESSLVELPQVLAVVTTSLNAVLFDEEGALSMLDKTLAGALGGTIAIVDSVFGALAGVLSLRANVQEHPDGGPFTQRALQVTTPFAGLNLANATVGPNRIGDPYPPGPEEPGGPEYPGPGTDRQLHAKVAVKAIQHGKVQTLTAWGFDPGEEVRAEVHQPVWQLPGTEIADVDGQVEFRFVIPDGFPVEWHTAYAISVEQGDWAGDTFEVVVPVPAGGGGLPLTGVGSLWLLLAGLALTLAGGGTVYAVRRYRGAALA